MVTPEDLVAGAVELHEARVRHEERLPISDTEIVGEAQTFSSRGPTVLILMRSTRRRTDKRGRELGTTYFLQGALVGPDGRRDACTHALLIHGATLPLLAEVFARAMRIDLTELERRATDNRPGAPAEPVVGSATVTP